MGVLFFYAFLCALCGVYAKNMRGLCMVGEEEKKRGRSRKILKKIWRALVTYYKKKRPRRLKKISPVGYKKIPLVKIKKGGVGKFGFGWVGKNIPRSVN